MRVRENSRLTPSDANWHHVDVGLSTLASDEHHPRLGPPRGTSDPERTAAGVTGIGPRARDDGVATIPPAAHSVAKTRDFQVHRSQGATGAGDASPRAPMLPTLVHGVAGWDSFAFEGGGTRSGDRDLPTPPSAPTLNGRTTAASAGSCAVWQPRLESVGTAGCPRGVRSVI